MELRAELTVQRRGKLCGGAMTTHATSPTAPSIRDEPERNRFVMRVRGGEAFATYRRANGYLVISHTEVPPTLRGQGIGSELAAGIFEFARSKGERIMPACSFLADWVRRHPEYRDVLAGKEA
ncbi:GNAT family N-acetyltransferase [Bosea sp. LjRoot9]|uniref:GNAT family N-acetyltransferase n=1 Tax=Bosea sp. LjRoot9 TaxID=3342341 RepID=UPI003ECDE6CF